ncbi:MAG: fructose-6-phosphate aldolase [Ignavibacteriaceae bacterium]
MKFFLDTANVDEIKEAKSWAILDGVTTNPSHVAKEGSEFIPLVEEICDILPDGDISVEVTTKDMKGILEEAREFVKIRKNIVVKVPLIKEGIKAINILSQEGVRINATLCFSAMQALIAAKVGATYISPFVGRLDAVGTDGMELVRQIRQIYDRFGYKTQVLSAALRSPMHVLESALIGADVATMGFSIMEQLFYHPLTNIGLEQFLNDWKELKNKLA